jgi:hypothetical protein
VQPISHLIHALIRQHTPQVSTPRIRQPWRIAVWNSIFYYNLLGNKTIQISLLSSGCVRRNDLTRGKQI